MAVRIRLSRIGKKNRPHWRVVAVDSKKKRDGAFLENLGSYDPIKHQILQLRVERIDDWVSKGAICSEAVLKLIRLKKNGIVLEDKKSPVKKEKNVSKLKEKTKEGAIASKKGKGVKKEEGKEKV